jgi:hypothetical protein
MGIRRVLPVLSVVGSVLVLTACSSVDITSDYDPGFDFSTLNTFNVLQFKISSSDPGGASMLVIQRVIESTKSELVYKGYTEASEDSADFLVVIHAGSQQQLQVDSGWGYGYWGGYGYGGWGGYGGGGTAYTYEEGTLAYDIVQRADKRAIWHGQGTAIKSDQPPSQEKIDDAVSQILASFPPGSSN